MLNNLPYTVEPVLDSATNQFMMHFVDPVAENYKQYTYRITGLNAFAAQSDPVEVTGFGRDNAPADPPVLKAASFKGDGSVEIQYQWDEALKDQMELHLLCSATPDGEFQQVFEKALDTSTDVFSFQLEESMKTARYFQLMANDTVGNTSLSGIRYAHLADSIPPVSPVGLEGSIDSTGIVTLNWDANTEKDLKGYRVFYANNPNQEFIQLTSHPIQDIQFKDTIALNTLTRKVYYRVQALDHRFNASPFTPMLELERPDTLAPVSPVFESVVIEDQIVLLNWQASSSEDVLEQIITRRAPDSSEKVFRLPANQFSLADTTAQRGQLYSYQIQVVDEHGNYSQIPTSVFARPLNTKGQIPIQNLKVVLNTKDGKVQLTWDYSGDDPLRFLLYKGKEKKSLKSFRSISGAERSFKDTVAKGTTVYYAIKVIGQNGHKSMLSKPVKAKKR